MISFRILCSHLPLGLQNIYNPQRVFSSSHYMPCGNYGYFPRYISYSHCMSYCPPHSCNCLFEALNTKLNDSSGYSYLPSYSSTSQRPGKYNGPFKYGRGSNGSRGNNQLFNYGRTCYGPHDHSCAPSYNFGCCYSSQPWGNNVSSYRGSCYEPRGCRYRSPYGIHGYEQNGYNSASYTCGHHCSSKSCGYGLSGYGRSGKKPRRYDYSSNNGTSSYDFSSHKAEYPYRRHSSSRLEVGNGDYYSGSSHESDYQRPSSRCSSNEEHS